MIDASEATAPAVNRYHSAELTRLNAQSVSLADRIAELDAQRGTTEQELAAARQQLSEVIAAGGSPAASQKRVRELSEHLDGIRGAIGILQAKRDEVSTLIIDERRQLAKEEAARTKALLGAKELELFNVALAAARDVARVSHELQSIGNAANTASALAYRLTYPTWNATAAMEVKVFDGWLWQPGLGPAVDALVTFIGQTEGSAQRAADRAEQAIRMQVVTGHKPLSDLESHLRDRGVPPADDEADAPAMEVAAS
ncbi:MAG: hypothetical protein M3Z05_21080 [Gemmatimonadota bacterium]|nr:hypothetical protein [Gemmatimonadota bacterium]